MFVNKVVYEGNRQGPFHVANPTVHFIHQLLAALDGDLISCIRLSREAVPEDYDCEGPHLLVMGGNDGRHICTVEYPGEDYKLHELQTSAPVSTSMRELPVSFPDGERACAVREIVTPYEVATAAIYFFEHGQLSPQLQWEEAGG